MLWHQNTEPCDKCKDVKVRTKCFIRSVKVKDLSVLLIILGGASQLGAIYCRPDPSGRLVYCRPGPHYLPSTMGSNCWSDFMWVQTPCCVLQRRQNRAWPLEVRQPALPPPSSLWGQDRKSAKDSSGCNFWNYQGRVRKTEAVKYCINCQCQSRASPIIVLLFVTLTKAKAGPTSLQGGQQTTFWRTTMCLLSFLSRIKKCLVTRQSIFNCPPPHHSKAGPVEPQGATRTPPSAGPTHAQRAQLLSEQPGRTNHLYLMIQMLIRVSQKYTNEKWNPLRISLGINLNRSKRIIEFDHV